jgi:hypothetical protein
LSEATTLPYTEPAERVRAFWNTEACGSHSKRFASDRDFFAEYRFAIAPSGISPNSRLFPRLPESESWKSGAATAQTV